MIRVREAIEAAGFPCIDGSRIPGGKDWRKVFYPALNNAVVYIPILSDTFLFSQACEDEITYAWDKRKKFLPVLFEEEPFAKVLRSPAQYTVQKDDICEVCPKLESMLNQRNRIPNVGRFMDNFESNIGDVIAQLRQMLPDGSAHLERISTSIDQPAAALLRRLDSVGAAAEGADASERVELEAELETAMQSLVQIVLDETSEPDSAAAALGELRYLTRDKWCSKVATGQGLIEACVGLLSRLSQRADPESKLCTEQAAAVLQNLSGPADDKLGSGYDHFDSTWHEPRAKLVSTLPGLLPLMEQSLLHGSEELQQHTANMVNSCICVSVQRDTQKQTRSDTQKRRSEVKAQMLQTGIVVALCGCMQEGSTKVAPAAQAANTLANMMYASPSVQQVVLDQGGLEAAAGLLHNKSSWLCFEKGAWVLKQLVRMEGLVGEAIIDAGVIPLLKRCFELSTVERCSMLHAVCQAADLLANLLENSGSDVAENIVASGIVEAMLPHLRDRMGKRLVHGMDGERYEIGAAGSVARALFFLARYSSCATLMVDAGVVPVLVEQLESGPLIRPKQNSKQPFVEWISGTLHALNPHGGCRPVPICFVIAASMSLPKLLSEGDSTSELESRFHLDSKMKQVSLRIEELVQRAVEERPEQILLSWGINGGSASKHNKELGLPKKRGSGECFKVQRV